MRKIHVLAVDGGSMKHFLLLAFFIVTSLFAFAQNAKTNGTVTCAAFPCVVATLSLSHQNAVFTQEPIYTPAASGLFRISYYEVVSPINGVGWNFTWSWTDDIKTRSFGPFLLTQGNYFNAGLPGIWVVAGQPITYTVTKGGNGTGNYDLFATIEQLQ